MLVDCHKITSSVIYPFPRFYVSWGEPPSSLYETDCVQLPTHQKDVKGCSLESFHYMNTDCRHLPEPSLSGAQLHIIGRVARKKMK